MRASFWLKYAFSRPISSFLRTPGFNSSKLAYTPSRVSYSASNAVAVFSPTPATPGMLSDLSPINAL